MASVIVDPSLPSQVVYPRIFSNLSTSSYIQPYTKTPAFGIVRREAGEAESFPADWLELHINFQASLTMWLLVAQFSPEMELCR